MYLWLLADEEVETRKLLLRRQTAANGPPMIRITLLAEDSRETVLKVEGDHVVDSATALEQVLARWGRRRSWSSVWPA